MLRNRAKRKYGTVAQEIQFSEFYRTAIISKLLLSGKTNNVVINGLRSALPLARARKPNNHIAQGSALGVECIY